MMATSEDRGSVKKDRYLQLALRHTEVKVSRSEVLLGYHDSGKQVVLLRRTSSQSTVPFTEMARNVE